jgi:Protein of unknown function (DUF3037)
MNSTTPGCEYTLLRYQPDPDEGEFFNVCLLLWDEPSRTLFWSTNSSTRRARRFFGTYDSAEHRRVCTSLEQVFLNIHAQVQNLEPTAHATLNEIVTAATAGANLPSPPFVWSSTRPVLESAFLGSANRSDGAREYFNLLADKFLGKPKRVFRPHPWNIWRLMYLVVVSILGVSWFGWRFLLFTLLLGVDPRLIQDWYTTDVEIMLPSKQPAAYTTNQKAIVEDEEDAVLNEELISDDR